MSRLLALVLVALVSLAPLTRMSVGAQEGQQPTADATDAGEWPWVGVGPIVELPPDDAAWGELTNFLGDRNQEARSLTASLNGYLVHFDNGLVEKGSAYIPEIIGVEFMVVVVSSGEFILDVKGPGSYLVDPEPVDGQDRCVYPAPVDDQDGSVNATPVGGQNGCIEILDGENTNEGLYYKETGYFITDENRNICGRLCTVLPGFAVKLEQGDRVIAPAGGICIWCLFQKEVEAPGTPTNATATPVPPATGTLLVFPLVRQGTFSWCEYVSCGEPGTPVATATAGRVTVGALRAAPQMAVFAFNPGGHGCHRGG